MSDDFSPIAEHGEAEAPPRFRDRLKRQPIGESVEPGFEKVWLGAGGQVLDGPGSAGDRRFGPRNRWVKVDVRRKALQFELPWHDETGRVGLLVRVGLEVAVARDQVGDVASGGEFSVRGLLLPRLEAAVGSVEPTDDGLSLGDRSTDEVSSVNRIRAKVERAVRGGISSELAGRVGWLTVSVTSVSVVYDQGTSEYIAALLQSERSGAVNLAAADAEMNLRDVYRERLMPHLSSPEQRVFEVAMHDPTAEHIAHAVAQAERAEGEIAQLMFGVLKTLIENDDFDVNNPSAIPLINSIRQNLVQFGDGASSLLGEGEATKAPLDEGQSPVDEPTLGDIPIVEHDGDRTWGPK